MSDITPLLNKVHCMDALELMAQLPDASVDGIIADPPYNMTELDFETAIDWTAFWLQARRVLKTPKSPTILFSQQPFTTDLIMSNRKGWRYEIIWEKTMPVGFLDANRRPLRCHENIQLFADGMPEYTPQMEESNQLRAIAIRSDSAKHYNKHIRMNTYDDNGTRYPRSVWKFAQRDTAFKNTKTLHPTQKPVGIMERLILTYTQPGWIILDPFCGSGSTGVAAQKLNRQWILNDIAPQWAKVSTERLARDYTVNMFELEVQS